MGGKKVIASLSWLTALAGVGVFYFSFWHVPGPSFNRAPHLGLGHTAAREAVKLLGPNGRIFLIHRDSAAFKNPIADTQVKGFQKALTQAGHKIAATNLLRLDPLRLALVPPGDFFELLRRTTAADVMVSFLGPPDLTVDQGQALKISHARVVAVCSGNLPQQMNLKALFERQLLHVAIISRILPQRSLPENATPQAWFDLLYEVVTPANLGDLPAPPPKRF